MDKNDKLKKHLNFCMKYPETVIGADESKLMVQYESLIKWKKLII